MASLQRRASGLYLLNFRYANQRFQRSLHTQNERQAKLLKATIEERLRLLEEGTLVLPSGSSVEELWEILLHGRLLPPPPKLTQRKTLLELSAEYLASYPDGSKDPRTLATETKHLNHLQRLLGSKTCINDISADMLRCYITERQKQPGNGGGTVKADTIRKELATFQLVWKFACAQGYACNESPLSQVRRPKKREKPPFQTWEQIERRIQRGGLTQREINELWECLFLRESEVAAFLEHVKKVSTNSSRFQFIYPALSFCAYTGARRSEMFRCAIDDIQDGLILIREKKKSQASDYTFRQIPLHPDLESILEDWLDRHPGGQYLFCKYTGKALEDRTSREGFKAVTRDSRWSVLRGYHILRHSFASNLARSGRVTTAEIDELMGHRTEEMRRRYRHLFPEDKKRAVSLLNYATG